MTIKLGVIGYGSRIRGMIDSMKAVNPDCEVVGIVDPKKSDGITSYATADELISKAQPDGLLIGTRCSLHTRYALEVLPSGIPLFLEKPVCTTIEDWNLLKEASERYAATPVVVSHPLRLTSIVQLVKDIIDSGTIGTVEHVQSTNNVPYGSVYYQSWYRDDSVTGGLFLQKATHDFDYINYLVGKQPVGIMAMTSKQIFKGDKPAGLKCVDCEENRTCPNSTIGTSEEEIWPYCCYAVDTGNEDSGSALIRYDSGMHVAYSQNFFARKQAGRRGARLLGHKGTVEFDFMTGKVQVFHHLTDRVDTYELSGGNDHFGGDTKLAANFIDIIHGRAKSLSTLEDGLISARMCLMARLSAESNSFQSL